MVPCARAWPVSWPPAAPPVSYTHLERILFAKTGKNADGQFGGGLDCRFINANLEQSVNLYRMDRDENMELEMCIRDRGAPVAGTYKEVLNSDDEAFGGSGAVHNKSVRTHKKPCLLYTS